MRRGCRKDVIFALLFAGCARDGASAIDANFLPGVAVSAAHSEAMASCTACPLGHPLTVALAARDALGHAYSRTDFVLAVAQPAPAGLRVGAWSADASGTLQLEVTPLVAGPLPPLVLLINGQPLPPLSLTAYGVRAAAGLAFVAAPTSARLNTAFSPQVEVALVDAQGVTITDGPDASAEVVLAAAPGGAAALIGGTAAGAATGVASFPGLASAAPGDLRLVATATLAGGQHLTATSSVVAVAAGAPAQVVVDFAQPGGAALALSDAQAIALGPEGASLREAVHLDAAAADFASGTGTGVVWDAGLGALRLGDANGCDGMRANCAALDASWAPRWQALAGYWPLDGAGNLADGAQVQGVVGPPLTAHNSNGTGMHYGQGQVGQGVVLDGVDDYLSMPAGILAAPEMTLAAWISLSAEGDRQRFFDFAEQMAAQRGSWLSVFTSNQGWSIETGWKSGIYDQANGQTALGGWAHLAVTLDGQQVALFVNGNRVGTIILGTGFSPYFSAKSLLVGASNYPGDPTLGGGIDELALWSEALSPAEIAWIYQRQRARFAGTFVSRPMDLLSGGQAITSLRWQTPQPFLKPLPDAAAEEAAHYPGQAAGLQAAIAGHWRLDEEGPSPTGTYDFADVSGAGNNATFLLDQPGNLSRGAAGPFAQATALRNGAFMQGQEAAPAPDTFSYQLWFQTGLGAALGPLMGFSAVNGTGVDATDRLLYVNSDGALLFGIYPGYSAVIESAKTVTDLDWHHAVASLGPGGQRLFLDGALVASAPSQTAGQAFSGYLKVGYLEDQFTADWPNAPSNNVTAIVGEAALWQRELSSGEVLSLFRRGANRLQHQLRACAAADCSDQPPWQGPDGTPQTAFSELDNQAAGVVLPGAPSLAVAGVAGRAVQYRTFFASDDGQNLCAYGGSGAAASPCSPELGLVGLEPSHVSTEAPSLSFAAPVPCVGLTGLSAVLGPGGCPGGLSVLLSADGVRWWAWGGSAWQAVAPSAAAATPLSALSSAALQAFAPTAGAGGVTLRLFLPSNGTAPCAVRQLTVDVLQ